MLQAPGITFGVGVAAEALADLAVADSAVAGPAAAAVESGPSRLTLIVALGMTWATAGFALSRVSSPAETVAANELTVLNCRTWVAWTWPSSVISGFWSARVACPRCDSAALPTAFCASWLFRITMTLLFTFLDSCAASAEVIGVVVSELAAATGAAVAAPATAAGTTTSAGTAVTATAAVQTLRRANARRIRLVMRVCMPT